MTTSYIKGYVCFNLFLWKCLEVGCGGRGRYSSDLRSVAQEQNWTCDSYLVRLAECRVSYLARSGWTKILNNVRLNNGLSVGWFQLVYYTCKFEIMHLSMFFIYLFYLFFFLGGGGGITQGN